MATSPRTSPTVLRWELGARLRALLTRAGLSIDDASKELMCSQAKVSRMETAGRGIQPRDVRDLCRLYAVSDEVRDELIKMANDARRPGWWQQYGTLNEQTATYIGLESAATSIMALESRVFPGLLQTPAYAQVLLQALVPLEQVDDMVETRKRRFERVRNREVQLAALLDEAVFDRTLGRPDIMGDQLEFIIECASRDNITIQMIPLTAEPNPGIHGSFMHLAFGGRELLDVIFFESILGNTFVDRPNEVEQYVHAYEASEKQALSPEKTLEWLQRRVESSAPQLKPQPRKSPPSPT